MREHDITPHVVASLDAEDVRKDTFIRARVVAPLRPVFRQFVGLKGSAIRTAYAMDASPT